MHRLKHICPEYTSRLVFVLLLAFFSQVSIAQDRSSEITRDLLEAVMSLHDLTENDAIDRLVKEQDATGHFQIIESMQIDGYAGSWFDSESLRLTVALVNPSSAYLLKPFDVNVRIVSHSIKDLTAKRNNIADHLNASGRPPILAFVDIRSNRVVISSLEVDKVATEEIVNSMRLGVSVDHEISNALPQLSGNVRGGLGTRNTTWAAQYGGTWPCSIGASVTGGYITAGHCGQVGNDFDDTSSTNLSEMAESGWYASNIDTGYAEIVSGWTLKPEVHGYTDGVFSVESDWGGFVTSPIGATICRYGDTSGGPHCGTVDSFDVSVTFGSKTITGLTQLVGSCSDDGDSGGPHVSSAGHIQGTNTGVRRWVSTDSCPTQAENVWFQPAVDALDEYSLTLLTPHGEVKPTITSDACPDWDNSGENTYACVLNAADSQGEVSLSWSTNTGDSSTIQWLTGTCNTNQTVSVTLNASNSYGARVKTYSFSCPTGPLP